MRNFPFATKLTPTDGAGYRLSLLSPVFAVPRISPTLSQYAPRFLFFEWLPPLTSLFLYPFAKHQTPSSQPRLQLTRTSLVGKVSWQSPVPNSFVPL